MNKEEQLIQKRLIDLASLADRRSIVTFSDFLNLNELNIYHSSKKELSFVKCQLFGGYEYAERQMIAFIPDALCYNWDYPLQCVDIKPLNDRFAEDLGHRDFLGAVLNLGIERSKIGDILITDNGALIFCHASMTEFLCKELTRIRHTMVSCRAVTPGEIEYTPKLESVKGTVASVRLDSLLSLAFGSSRSSLAGLIEGGKVFVNGKMITSNGYKMKEKDIVSVR